MKINVKKVFGSIGAVVLGLGGLIAAGKAGFCENLGKSDEEAPAEPNNDAAPAAEPTEEVEAEEVKPDGEGE